MTTPIPDDKREEVLDLARTGLPRNEVARRTGVSTASVSRIAAAAGHSFDRTATATAVEARVIDLKAARIHAASGVLDDLQEARVRLREADTPRDFYFLARSISELASAHVQLVGIDGVEAGVEEAKSMLGNLMEALRIQHTDGSFFGDQDAVPAALPAAEPEDGQT